MICRTAGGIPVIAVSGTKNAGKTTLIQQILPYLRSEGLRVGVLKHDGHGFRPDTPGTDSDRLRLAGAEITAVFDREHCQLVMERQDLSAEAILSLFTDVDVILLEGFKHSDYPKLVLVRRGICESPCADPATWIAVCADMPVPGCSVPLFRLDDYPGIAAFLYERLRRQISEKT